MKKFGHPDPLQDARRMLTMSAIQTTIPEGVELTDYANVVVVDAGGLGDYTTLSAAMTAITDASATNRYCVLVFGTITESGDVTCVDYVDVFGMTGHRIIVTAPTYTFDPATAYYSNLILEGNLDVPLLNTQHAYFFDCVVNAGTFTNSGYATFSGGQLGSVQMDTEIDSPATPPVVRMIGTLIDCTSGSAISISNDGTLYLFGCFVTSSTASPVVAITSTRVGKLYAYNSCFAASGSATYVLSNSGNNASKAIVLYNCQLLAGSSGASLSTITPSTGTYEFVHCTFSGTAVAATTWDLAPFYECQFLSTLTKISPKGTIRGGTLIATSYVTSAYGAFEKIQNRTLDVVLTFDIGSATYNAISDSIIIQHSTTSTPQNGYGARLNIMLMSSASAIRAAGAIDAVWNVATDASRIADLVLSAAYSGGLVEGLRIRGGAGVAIGLYGVAPVVRPATGGSAATFAQNSGNAVNDASTFDGYTLGQIVKALRDIGALT